jgi:ribosomal protein S27E
MKIEELKKLGLLEKTLAELEIDAAYAITRDEFNREAERDAKPYRERAIDRLLEAKVSWHSNANIVYEVAKASLRLECLYCGGLMAYAGGGGNFSVTTVRLRCENCKAEGAVTLLNEGISFTPPSENN